MPEGDTLVRTADGLRPYLLGRTVTAASARAPGPRVERLVGATVTGVEAQGKNLLIRFDNGLEVRTHLRMHGSWHRYRPGERWRRAARPGPARHRGPGTVAVCFDAPTVELFEQRVEAIHPSLARLGPDLLREPVDVAEALRRLRDPSRAALPVAVALLDQRALAGIGNEVKNEVLWQARVPRSRRSGTWTTPRCASWSTSAAPSSARAPRPAPAAPRLPPFRPSVPALRRDHPRRAPGAGRAAPHVLVPGCQPDPRSPS